MERIEFLIVLIAATSTALKAGDYPVTVILDYSLVLGVKVQVQPSCS
jgi:hypothetical protein